MSQRDSTWAAKAPSRWLQRFCPSLPISKSISMAPLHDQATDRECAPHEDPRISATIADENCVLGDITYPGPSLFHLLLRPEIFIEPHSLLKHREIPTSTLNLFQSPTASDSLYTPPRMSSIALLGRSTEIYSDAAAFGIHIFDNHSLFEGDELFEGNPIEDLYDQVYTLRRWTGEPIAHMPVSRI